MHYYKYTEKGDVFEKIVTNNLDCVHIADYPLWEKKINENQTLIINSYQNNIYLVPTDMVCSGKIPIQIALQPKVKEKKKAEQASFILAPSYKCNMSCIYCYQQNDKTLSKKKITKEHYDKFVDFVNQNKRKYKSFDLQLFGGEPLLLENKDIILVTLELTKKNNTKLSFTTNGLTLTDYLKMFIIYRKYIGVIATTIDGLTDSHLERRFSSLQSKDTQIDMKRTIRILLDAGIEILVAMNIDKKNINELSKVIRMLQKEGFFDYNNFKFEIGRVDDRLYETGYPEIIDEIEIIKVLMSMESIPQNVSAAFIKTGYNILDKFNLAYNQDELRGQYDYCWSVNSSDKVFYIDNDLDVFRCTYTVGRKQFKIGNVESGVDDSLWFEHGAYYYEECKNCKIGGFCSGGCRLSYIKNKEKQCNWELTSFDKLMDEIVIPRLKLGEIINNEKNTLDIIT